MRGRSFFCIPSRVSITLFFTTLALLFSLESYLILTNRDGYPNPRYVLENFNRHATAFERRLEESKVRAMDNQSPLVICEWKLTNWVVLGAIIDEMKKRERDTFGVAYASRSIIFQAATIYTYSLHTRSRLMSEKFPFFAREREFVSCSSKAISSLFFIGAGLARRLSQLVHSKATRRFRPLEFLFNGSDDRGPSRRAARGVSLQLGRERLGLLDDHVKLRFSVQPTVRHHHGYPTVDRRAGCRRLSTDHAVLLRDHVWRVGGHADPLLPVISSTSPAAPDDQTHAHYQGENGTYDN